MIEAQQVNIGGPCPGCGCENGLHDMDCSLARIAMTYTVKNHPGGYDIYKDGKPLDANEVVRLLEQLPKSGNNLPNAGK